MELTTEMKVERLWDTLQVSNLMSRYAYLHTNNEHMKTVELFALDRDDIWIECGGIGIYTGAEGIEKFFYTWHESLNGSDANGMFNEHLLTTPLIEVAADGQTAKAVWMSPGAETRRAVPQNDIEAIWIWGKYAVDFIKQNGKWKMWHFTITQDFMTDYHHSWVEEKKSYTEIKNDGIPKTDKPNTFEDGYHRDRLTSCFSIPEPYDTYQNDPAEKVLK